MLKDLSKRNRSYRKFDPSVPISMEQLRDWVDNARYAPSSVNIQPLKYRLVADPAICARLFPLTGWARLLPDYPGPAEGERPTAYVVICCDQSIGTNLSRFAKDVGIVAQTIMLSAVASGFGGCMIGNFVPEEVTKTLSLPSQCIPCLILALGKPAEEIFLETIGEDGKTAYYRDATGRHHVPKRNLEQVLI